MRKGKVGTAKEQVAQIRRGAAVAGEKLNAAQATGKQNATKQVMQGLEQAVGGKAPPPPKVPPKGAKKP